MTCVFFLLQIEVKEVTKVHSDNKLSEMLELFEQDCKAMNHYHLGPREMRNIGEALTKALGEFNEDFLPHMKEEEEVRSTGLKGHPMI